jgi:hypothetical protein
MDLVFSSTCTHQGFSHSIRLQIPVDEPLISTTKHYPIEKSLHLNLLLSSDLLELVLPSFTVAAGTSDSEKEQPGLAWGGGP